MASQLCFLGIDIHDRGLDLILLGPDGERVGHLKRTYAGTSELPSEQDPQDWWRAARTGIKKSFAVQAAPPGTFAASD